MDKGDSRIEYTELGILNALESLGIRADKADKSRNIAAVMITAEIGPLCERRHKVRCYSFLYWKCRFLTGGILLQTPLIGADGQVYAVFPGPVSIGGLTAGNGGGNVQVNHPTVGMVIKMVHWLKRDSFERSLKRIPLICYFVL